MAGPYYVRSADGNDADDGLSWANAKLTFGAAVALAAAGERIYVDDDHQETLAADTTYTFAGTEGNPVEVIVVTTDTTTAVSNYNASNQWIDGNDLYHIFISGTVYFWGINLVHGDTAYNFVGNGRTVVFENSRIANTGIAAEELTINVLHSALILINTDVSFASSASYIEVQNGATFIWLGGTLTGNLNNVFYLYHAGSVLKVIGVDLSSVIGGNLILIQTNNVDCIKAYLKGIKLNATTPTLVTAGQVQTKNSEFIMDIADNGNTVYKFRREYQYGYAQDETTKVITGKALYDGTNEFTVKMVSRATPTCSFYDPWRYHLTTLRETGFAANRTYTVHIAQDHASAQPDALDNGEIWLEVVYPDDSTAQFNISTDKIATPTTTPAAQTTSTESWEGLAATTRLQELAVTINSADGKNGPVEIWVCVAKPDTAIYVCPEVYVS